MELGIAYCLFLTFFIDDIMHESEFLKAICDNDKW